MAAEHFSEDELQDLDAWKAELAQDMLRSFQALAPCAATHDKVYTAFMLRVIFGQHEPYGNAVSRSERPLVREAMRACPSCRALLRMAGEVREVGRSFSRGDMTPAELKDLLDRACTTD